MVNQNNFTMQGLLGKTSCNNYHFVTKFLRDTDLAKRIYNLFFKFQYLLIHTPAQSVAVNAPLSWFANRQKKNKRRRRDPRYVLLW